MKKVLTSLSLIMVSIFTVSLLLLQTFTFADVTPKKKKLMEGSNGTFCCCPGSSDCAAADCKKSVCDATANPDLPY